MNTNAKFRPSLTLSQIKLLAKALSLYENSAELQTEETSDLLAAKKTLGLTLAKADLGAITPSYVPTGTKPGRPSAVSQVLGTQVLGQQPSQESDSHKYDFNTLEGQKRAYIESQIFVSMGLPVPQELAEAALTWKTWCEENSLNPATGASLGG